MHEVAVDWLSVRETGADELDKQLSRNVSRWLLASIHKS